jgi:hypothetical protein
VNGDSQMFVSLLTSWDRWERSVTAAVSFASNYGETTSVA